VIGPRAVAALALAGVCCACSLAPRYQRPPTALPPAGYQELDGWKIAAPADLAPKGPWWEIYQDPALDALEAQLADANQSLKAAFARLQEARAQTAINRAAYFPSLTADARATQGALDQAVYRYHGGIVTYLEVVSTENAALTARLSAVDIQTRRIAASVLLVNALGGSWHAP
jgi:outer membrane protein TolC